MNITLKNIYICTKEYETKFKTLLDEKTVIQNLSLLFNMSQEPFANLDVAYQYFNCVRAVYNLYSRQKNARDVWAKTLWSELQPNLLLEGMDHFLKEFKQLPRDCRNLSVGQVLEKNMKKFKNAIPLFIELKNDAMRDIHWKMLMEKTGEFPTLNKF